jgi:hypothetical protein
LTLKFCPNSTILCQNRHFFGESFFLNSEHYIPYLRNIPNNLS